MISSVTLDTFLTVMEEAANWSDYSIYDWITGWLKENTAYFGVIGNRYPHAKNDTWACSHWQVPPAAALFSAFIVGCSRQQGTPTPRPPAWGSATHFLEESSQKKVECYLKDIYSAQGLHHCAINTRLQSLFIITHETFEQSLWVSVTCQLQMSTSWNYGNEWLHENYPYIDQAPNKL